MWINGEEVDPNDHMPLVLLNPELTLSRETEIGPEGCLSIPEVSADITRATRVTVKATDLEGKPVEFEAEGLLSRDDQHETDHLNGILFIDGMNTASKCSLDSKLKRFEPGQVFLRVAF